MCFLLGSPPPSQVCKHNDNKVIAEVALEASWGRHQGQGALSPLSFCILSAIPSFFLQGSLLFVFITIKGEPKAADGLLLVYRLATISFRSAAPSVIARSWLGAAIVTHRPLNYCVHLFMAAKRASRS